MRWLGLDIGEKTIGVAVSDEGEVVATPLRTLPRRGGSGDLEAVGQVLQEIGAGGVVLGLPLTLEGHEGDAARRVRALGSRLADHLGCPVHYWDERFTTVQAEQALLEGNVRRRRRREVVDKVAASIILQSFLDRAAGGAAS
jgi:putative Holliday junction resolvase